MTTTHAAPSPVCDEIRRAPPLAHGGGTAFFGLEWDALRWLERSLEPGMTTLETGCGASTIVFAAAGTRHLTISPDPSEHDRPAGPRSGRWRTCARSCSTAIRRWRPSPAGLPAADAKPAAVSAGHPATISTLTVQEPFA